MRFYAFVFFSTFLLMFTGSISTAKTSPEMVFVSILPQKFFVQQISGRDIGVEVMVLPGASPATYEPKPSQMRKLAKSRAYFAIGVPFEEAWLGKISAVNPAMQVIHTDKDIQKLTMDRHSHHDEQHEEEHHDAEHHEAEHHEAEHHEEKAQTGDGHDHEHSGLDPHIWLSPVLMKTQVRTIYEGLSQLFPEKRVLFQKNYTALLSRLDQLHEELQKELAPIHGKTFMVFHPSWGYFAKEYGLRQIAIEIEGKKPKPAQLRELVEHGRELGITAILAQSQFSTKNAEIVARELGGEVIIVDPLAEDYFANLKIVSSQLSSAAK